MYTSRDENGKATKGKVAGVATLGAGIGAAMELGKLRDKINKQYAEECAKADAAGRPRPPRPDTSKKTLLALLKGSVKGFLGGTAISFIPGVSRALKDTAATLQATGNKFLTGGKLGNVVAFSFMNTFLPTREFSEAEKYTLTYLSDEDFGEINLSNLDIGEVTEIDLLKCFFSLANIAGQVYDKQSLQQYFDNKTLSKDNPQVEKDAKMLGLSNAAMPVIGAISGGVYGGIKARKRALKQWEEECKIADAKGLPRPPKPSILTVAGDVAKNATIGGGIGYLGSKIAPNLNTAISSKLDDWGLTSSKSMKNAYNNIYKDTKLKDAQEEIAKLVAKSKEKPLGLQDSNRLANLQAWVQNKNYKQVAFSVSFNQYRAALARKGQHTTLTEEQFNNCSPECYEILIRNMQPINFSSKTDRKTIICSKLRNR